MDFIFMLTNQDRTVKNCLEIIDSISELGLGHIGFKDVGVEQAVLAELTLRIAALGAISYVEVVSTTPETIRNSIEASSRLKVDRVLGGQDVDFALQSFGKDGPRYFPFPGRPIGHPTKLAGGASDVEEDSRKARLAGCPGVDLLAYRATEADPEALIRAARRGLGPDGYLIVAGSIDSEERIKEAEQAGADAFTIGSAIFEDKFAAGVKGVKGQCEAVLRAIGQ